MTFIVTLFQTLILGIVEGITEWLPISSTGHLILVNEFLKNENTFTSSDLFVYVIQLGAILAVVTLYFRKLNPFAPSKTKQEKSSTWQMWFKVVVGCIPAAVIGLAVEDYMENIENWQIVSIMLIVYGIAFIIAESFPRKSGVDAVENMSYKTALMIGFFQVLSIIPGTSRSGATILGAILLGCSRTVAAEFSFFLSIPVMFGVSFIKIVKNLDMISPSNIFILLFGMIVAYLVSLAVIRFLIGFVKKHDFKGFGYYRIVLGLLVIIYFIFVQKQAFLPLV